MVCIKQLIGTVAADMMWRHVMRYIVVTFIP